jgi:hypothetical protein
MRSQSCQWLALTVTETGGLVYVHHLTTKCHLLAPAIQSMKIQSSLPVMMNLLGLKPLARNGQGVSRPGWSELAPTNAPVEDEPVQLVLRMNILPARCVFFLT